VKDLFDIQIDRRKKMTLQRSVMWRDYLWIFAIATRRISLDGA